MRKTTRILPAKIGSKKFLVNSKWGIKRLEDLPAKFKKWPKMAQFLKNSKNRREMKKMGGIKNH